MEMAGGLAGAGLGTPIFSGGYAWLHPAWDLTGSSEMSTCPTRAEWVRGLAPGGQGERGAAGRFQA